MAAQVKQNRPLAERDDRDRLGGVNGARAQRRATVVSRDRSPASTAHTLKSLAALIRPPLNFRSSATRG
jgi:hypothetical protein